MFFSVSKFPLFIRTSFILDWRPTLLQYGFILTNYAWKKTYFQIMSVRIRTSVYKLERTQFNSQHLTFTMFALDFRTSPPKPDSFPMFLITTNDTTTYQPACEPGWSSSALFHYPPTNIIHCYILAYPRSSRIYLSTSS